MLASETFGSGQPALAFLHGFTQTRESWRPIARTLSKHHQVTLIDLPGHGKSDPSAGDLWIAGRQVVEASGPGILVGYSMGARVALHAALVDASPIVGLVLIGAHGGIIDPSERAERIASDDLLADRILRIGVARFIEEWTTQPMFSNLVGSDHSDRLANTAQGLAQALRALGTGTQTPLDDTIRSLNVPVMLIAGEEDEKFVRELNRLNKTIAHVESHVIAGSGHACHLEKPDEVVDVLNRWLADLF